MDLQNISGEALYVFQQSLYCVMREKMKESQVARASGNMEEFMQKEVQKVLDNMAENNTPEEDLQEMKELFDSFIESTRHNSSMSEPERQAVAMSFVERFQTLQSSLEHSSDEAEDETQAQLEKKIDAACYVKDVRKIRRWLRSRKIHVDFADSNGETLLNKAMISAQRNSDSGDNLGLVRLLLREGVDIEGASGPGLSGTAATFAGAAGLPSCKELLLRTHHAREMWMMWVKCRALCDQQRACAPDGIAGCLVAVGEDIFRECIKWVWGPKRYEATMREQTLPLPEDATMALGQLQEVCNDDFLRKWKLLEDRIEDDDAEDEEGDNVKADESQLELIWSDFRDNCSYEEHLNMIALGGGSPAEM